jgi:photosystem II stability/assembly factor-like uncharacterized protein
MRVRFAGLPVVLHFFLIAAVFSIAIPGGTSASAQQSLSAPEKLPVDPDALLSSQSKEGDEDSLFPAKRELWFKQQRAYPNKRIPVGAYWHSQLQKQALVAKRRSFLSILSRETATVADPFSTITWTPDGPQPIAPYSGVGAFSGRATSIAVHPTDPNTVYLGTAGGGVWKTTNGGQSWTPLTDSQASLATGAIAIDPNNPNTVYVGTGEPDSSVDSYYGQGLLKSTDSGATWTLIRTPFANGDTAADIHSIAVQPGNSDVILVGDALGAWNGTGLFRSADAGQTWAQVISPGGYAGVTSVLFDVQNPAIAYAAVGGFYPTATGTIYMSSDAGKTWASISGSSTSAVPAPSTVLRASLSETADGKTLFAGFSNSNFSGPGELYSTSNSGASWTNLSAGLTDALTWYENSVAVDPANSKVIYVVGTGLWASMDGGQTWTRVNNTIYADQHAVVFSKDGSRLFLADDGGIFVTTQPAVANAPFSSLNSTINTLTFYPGFSIVPGHPNSALAGSQDHGVNLYAGSLAWQSGEQSGFCGDGGGVYVDPQGKYAYAHCQGGPANWAANATGDSVTTNWTSAQNGINKSDRWPWVADIKGDPQAIANVYTGTQHLYQSTDNAALWTSISPDLTAGSSIITTIGVSPSDSNTIYTGAGDGTVSLTTNALAGTSATWTTLTGLPNRTISKIVVEPDSPKDVYLTVSGFDSGHVFHSTNGGAAWTDISGDLPNTPVNSILVDPGLLNTIYAATDTGVYATANGGTNWVPLGSGLPNVVIQDILMYQPTRTLRVITHGRGAWDAVVPLVGLESSLSTLSFGNQAQNTTSTSQSFTLSNNLQSNAITITGFQVIGPFTQTNNCGGSLNSGSTCTVNVSFAPTTAGTFQGSLIVSSNTNSAAIALSGTGLGVPNVQLGSSAITFSTQPVGLKSAGQSLTLTNSGDASLTNIAISIGGTNSTDFSQSTTCGTTLAAGANCTISIVFTPGGTGSRSATVSIADNAAGSPQSTALTGQGEAPFAVSATATSASVAAGQSTSYALTVTAAQSFPLGSAVSFSCSGLPSLSNCSFSPTSVATGATTQAVTLTVSTTPSTSPSVATALGHQKAPLLAAICLVGLFLIPRRRNWFLVALLFVLLTQVPACSGGGSTTTTHTQGTPTGTYTLTVNASQGSAYQTTQSLTLTVN